MKMPIQKNILGDLANGKLGIIYLAVDKFKLEDSYCYGRKNFLFSFTNARNVPKLVSVIEHCPVVNLAVTLPWMA
jgi:hypothetical protein